MQKLNTKTSSTTSLILPLHFHHLDMWHTPILCLKIASSRPIACLITDTLLNVVKLLELVIMLCRILYQALRFHSLLAISGERSHVWDIFASVALIRPPIIAPPMHDVEKRYHDFIFQRELEDSFRCDFELRQLRDEWLLKERETLKMNGEEVNLKEEIGVLASMDEENWRKRADRIRKELTIGDLTKGSEINACMILTTAQSRPSRNRHNCQNVSDPKYEQHICFTLQTCRFSKADSKSLKRKIDEFLVLIVCQKFDREDSYHLPWHLPQLQNLPGESLKQTSIRCLKELFSIEMYGKGITNAPFSVYVYHYPAQLRRRLKTSSRGAAIFFFKAMYMKHIPLIANRDEVADYKWEQGLKNSAENGHTNAIFLAF
ncbi:hypothetical protein DINM_002569 [Dirofilaria immitis]|nr:hypothetical protein [Dirofilaria immitis]